MKYSNVHKTCVHIATELLIQQTNVNTVCYWQERPRATKDTLVDRGLNIPDLQPWTHFSSSRQEMFWMKHWNMYNARKNARYIVQNININSTDFLSTITVAASPFTAYHREHCSCCCISVTMPISWCTFGKLSSSEWCIIHQINHFCQQDGIFFLFPRQNNMKLIFLWEDKMGSLWILCLLDRASSW